MYIKVGNSNEGNYDALRQSKKDAENQSAPNLMERRVQANNISSINSLNFMHRPQRVSQMRANLFPDEEIMKNTNLNKRLSTDTESSDEGLSPTKHQGSIPSLYNDEQLPLPPVYKKSGELLKSSLKLRSKSLPTSPYINNENKNFSNVRPGKLQRSKSVHFDQKTPIKYFCEDEKPIDVGARPNDKTEDISYQHKPVRSIYDDPEEDYLSMGIDRLSLDTSEKPKTPRNLRKSKRFSDFLKEQSTTRINTNNVLQRPQLAHKSNSGSNLNGGLSNGRQHRVVGLYNVNFPILSNKNPKALKLNIFINLSRGKNCFLQDLTLCTHKSASDDNAVNSLRSDSTRLIIGRVLVKNIFFDKRVVIMYTWNAWQTVREAECVYVSDGDAILPGTNMDLFKFIIDDVNKTDPRAKLEFCIHYITRDDFHRQEYWDNNNGQNYKLDCILDGFHNPFAAGASE